MLHKYFGKHLYGQIVYPLVAASVLVGLVATLVAVYFLGGLTENWVDNVAQGAIANLESRFDARARNMQRFAELLVEEPAFKSAVAAGDFDRVSVLLSQKNVALDFDNIALLEPGGAVVSMTGSGFVALGDRPLAGTRRAEADRTTAHPMFVSFDERVAIAALRPIQVEDGIYTLMVSAMVDDEFLGELAGGTGDAFAFFGNEGSHVAHALKLPDSAIREEVSALDEAIHSRGDAIGEAVDSVEGGDGTSLLEVGPVNYYVKAARLKLSGDPVEDSLGYIAVLQSQAVTDQAKSTTTNLITMWSVIAVLALAGLGGWVARRVSDPLMDLTEGARRVKDGDFSAKIAVEGANEISDLAETFNQMTDSLRDRSESLTKKVLELATLYEMSRALGSTLEMDTLLDSVLDSALRIFGVDTGYITLRDRETGRLELRTWRASGEPRTDEDALRNSMSEWVIREGRPLIFNPPRDSGEARVEEVTGALAALCVPLMSPEGTLGSITVGSRDSDFRFTSDDVRLLSTIANHVTIAIGNIDLFSSLQESYLSTVRSLAAAVDAKDPFTRGHSDRVAGFAVMIAERLGLSHDQTTALEMAAYLHDIGKIGVREEILLKPGRLTDGEMGEMRHHPLIGANILKPVGFPWPITPVVRHHHERWDGGGYPAGLKGEEIPLLARVLTVADAYEAMVADRPYRRGRTIEEAIEELRTCSGSQFDERVVDAFVAGLEERLATEGEVRRSGLEELLPEETEAIFVALSEGMFTSFKKLGGPKLASNVENDLNGSFEDDGLPFKVVGGHVTLGGNGNGRDREPTVDEMREALKRMDELMGRMSGASLVDHFYADAAAALSERMRLLAIDLEFIRE